MKLKVTLIRISWVKAAGSTVQAAGKALAVPKAPCSIVNTWALKGLLYHKSWVYASNKVTWSLWEYGLMVHRD